MISLLFQKNISRRNLLGKLGKLLATASGLSLARDVALAGTGPLLSYTREEDTKEVPTASDRSYTIAPWTGDDFTLGHRLRKKQFPNFPDTPDRKVDFVIVGGGVAGLTAALYLNNENYLLLEQYGEVGGHSRGSNWSGLGFSYGSTLIDHPQGMLGELLDDLDLKPIRLDESSINWLWDSRWIKGSGVNQDALRSEFERFKKQAQAIWQTTENGNIFAPLTDSQLLKLDQEVFSNSLTGYSEQFVSLINSYLKSYLGGGAASVSALSAFAVLSGLVEPGYVLPGGNATIVESLGHRLLIRDRDRIKSKSFVWSIEVKDNSSLVTYGGEDGVCHKVQCRHVIVTTPHLVSARILNNLSDVAKSPLFGFRYCSYLVATLLLKKSILEDGYAHFTGHPLSFSELLPSETPYKLSGKYKARMGAALTVLQPYEPASNGRGLLLAGDREAFAEAVVKQVKQLSSDLEGNLERVVLTRWGHALAVPGPGYFSKLNQLQQATQGSYSLAHSSAKGLPRLASAVAAARQAADSALKVKRLSTIYSIPKGD
jgi:phytoene dehydrogenase-like protein